MNIDDIISDSFNENKFIKKTSNGLLLTEEQINVLNRYGIDYNKYNNLKELLFDIELYLNDNPDLTELDEISIRLSELDYYQFTNK